MRFATCFLLAPVLLTGLWTASARAGGPLTSGELVAGNVVGPSFSESWTFNGTSGDRVIFVAVTTSGALNTSLRLIPPGGGPAVINSTADRIEYQLLNNGTYTLIVEDLGLNDPGTYNLLLMNITAGPVTGASDPDGGPTTSAEARTGTIGVGDIDAFTFPGNSGERVIIGALATAGAGFNTVIYVFPPGGGSSAGSTAGGDRLEVTLTASGTWTALVEDVGNDTPGDYTMTVLNVTAGPWTTVGDPDGTTITSSEILTGTLNSVVDMDVYRFPATAGDRVLFTDLVTAGSANSQVYIYPPGGGGAEVATSADRVDVQLALTGTYTLVIEDLGLNDTGTYTLSHLNVISGPLTNLADPDGGPIVSSEIKTGNMSGLGDFDAFTFTGNTNDRVIVGALATAGAGFNTNIFLYGPSGSYAVTSSGGDRLDTKLTATGTWTVVIEDPGNDTPGDYSMTVLDVTSGPYTTAGDLDGTTIASTEIKTGTFNGVVDLDVFQFPVTAGDRVLLTDIATGGGLHNTQVNIYPPGGGVAEVSSSADRIDHQFLVTGTYSLVIEDAGLNDTGTYSLSLLNVTSGPLTSLADPDGGPIVSAEVKTGNISGLGDFDAFTFTGNTNDRVIVGALATAGAGFNTNIYLYPPSGSAFGVTSGGGDRLEYKLNATGTWTIVIEDSGNDTPGDYSVGFLNVTSGPWTTAGDLDGTTLASSEIRTGAFNGLVDFDLYRFSGTAGDRMLLADVATGGGLHNVQINIYPPDGGPAPVSSSADRVDFQILSSGTYSIVVEDVGLNDTGSYTLGLLNVTSGPLTGFGDTDGGGIVSDQVKNGTMSGTGDFDAYSFNANANERVICAALATAGGAGFNTNLYLYPPGGGPVAISTGGGDRFDFKLNATGTWTLVVEDVGDVDAGSYTVSVLNATAGPFTDGLDSDGGIISPGVPYNGQTNPFCDFDGFPFYGLTGDAATISCIATSGTINTEVALYPPGGGVAVIFSTADVVNYNLAATGVYTLVIEDFGLNDTGTYQLTLSGTGTTSGAAEEPTPGVRPLALLPAAPSPFSQSTRLAFDVRVDGPVQLRIFNAAGALVRTLVDEILEPGRHEVTWDGRDSRGDAVGSGVYYLKLQGGGEESRQKVIRIG